jgi:hypothetical protein
VSRCKEAKKARPPFVPIYSRIAADLREELVKERSLKMNNEIKRLETGSRKRTIVRTRVAPLVLEGTKRTVPTFHTMSGRYQFTTLQLQFVRMQNLYKEIVQKINCVMSYYNISIICLITLVV